MRASSGPPLALTMGEPGGIGPEITAKAYRALKESGPVFFVIADPALFDPFDIPIAKIAAPHEVSADLFSNALPVLNPGVPLKAAAGRADPANAPAVIASIERAVDCALTGAATGVVTNPIQKSSLIAAGFKFPGHTEFLEALTADSPMPARRRRGAVMMIAGPSLRTVPITIHQSVSEAARSLSSDMIISKALIVVDALKQDFAISSPRLAISGLNPHAGESGEIGGEEIRVIAPAVKTLREAEGVNAFGPLSADTMFHAAARAGYDAALCMLHDQALIPAKTLAFDEAVNVTLGLPIVRTAPDHGTALDIAGKGVASPRSLISALNLAADMAAARRRTS